MLELSAVIIIYFICRRRMVNVTLTKTPAALIIVFKENTFEETVQVKKNYFLKYYS